MKYIKLFEEYEPLLSPEIAGMSPEDFARRKSSTEDRNKSNIEDEWLVSHPLEGVKAYGEKLVPRSTRWYLNPSGTYGYSVEFTNGRGISMFTGDGNKNNPTLNVDLGNNIEGKEELISWLHLNMRYHQIPVTIIEKLIREISLDIDKNRTRRS